MHSKIFLPHFIAVTMEPKLSSNKMIPEASFATSVPAIPIANPISAYFKAGPSFVPSPVTATTFSSYFNPVTKMNLSSGEDLANTLNSLAISLKWSKLPTVTVPSSLICFPSTSSLKVLPSITVRESGLC